MFYRQEGKETALSKCPGRDWEMVMDAGVHGTMAGLWSISWGVPRLPSLQILTLEVDAAEHLLIYFYCFRYVLQVLPKPVLLLQSV